MRYREDTGYPVLEATPPVRSRAYALVKIVPPAQFCPRLERLRAPRLAHSPSIPLISTARYK